MILPPTQPTAGQTVSVRIELQDSTSTFTSASSPTVTLRVTGSAVTIPANGFYTLTGGFVIAQIRDFVAETTQLSLSSPTPNTLSVSSTINVIFRPGT